MQNEPQPLAVSTPEAASPPAGSTSPSVSDQSSPAMRALAEDYRRHSESGARWFFWIAGLSIINSIVVLAEGRWNFLLGLGVTQVISGFALGLSEQLGSAVKSIALVLDLIVAGIFVGLGLFAQKHHTWAFIVGMVVYALDGLIFVLVQEWLSVAFHVFVLYSVYRGLAANRKLIGLRAEGLAPA